MNESRCVVVTSLVCVGASAGSLQPISELVAALPSDANLALVIVQHLSPNHKSMMREVISKTTTLRVQMVTQDLRAKAGHVYLMPAGYTVTLQPDGLLHLTQIDEDRRGLFPIDILLQSAASTLKKGAIAVVLSGTGSDGTLGARAIKDAGGTVLVQSPSSAQFDGMPLSVINAHAADLIASPTEITQALIRLTSGTVVDNPVVMTPAATVLERLVAAMAKASGFDLTGYRPRTLIRRAERRMLLLGVESLDDYADLALGDDVEASLLVQASLIGVTRFFRDEDVWDRVHAELKADDCYTVDGFSLRGWCVGCSTGEEPYTVVMTVIAALGNDVPCKIFATDIARRAVQLAAAGRYPDSISDHIPQDKLTKFFRVDVPGYKIAPSVRSRVVFSPHNVLTDPPFGQLDLITCRNMLIYLEPELQQRAITTFAYSLRTGGLLVLGSSEFLGQCERYFETVDARLRIFRRTSTRAPLAVNEGGRHAIAPWLSAASQPQLHTATRPKFVSLTPRIARRILSRYGMPVVIVDGADQIVASFGNVDAFVGLPAGGLVTDLQTMARHNLGVVIGAAVERARDEQRRIECETVFVDTMDYRAYVDVVAEPFVDSPEAENQVAVIFTARDVPAEHLQGASNSVSDDVSDYVGSLEQQLLKARSGLRSTIEQLEVANAELQVSNEELLASNEELQSTNEELHTVNEELMTVNAEHQSKIVDLIELGNDMDTLLRATGVGTVFIDEKHCIRRFSPNATMAINVINTDIGRPIGDLKLRLDYPGFTDDLTLVVDSLQSIERELRSESGGWTLVRLHPYRQAEGTVQGALVVFIDISESHALRDEVGDYRRDAQASVKRAAQRLHGTSLKVWVVEDDTLSAGVILSTFSHQAHIRGVHCPTLASARQRLALGEIPGVVLLDLELPDGNGLSLLKRLRENPQTASVPVIVVNGTDSEVRRQAYDSGANFVVAKGANLSEVPRIVEAIAGTMVGTIELLMRGTEIAP